MAQKRIRTRSVTRHCHLFAQTNAPIFLNPIVRVRIIFRMKFQRKIFVPVRFVCFARRRLRQFRRILQLRRFLFLLCCNKKRRLMPSFLYVMRSLAFSHFLRCLPHFFHVFVHHSVGVEVCAECDGVLHSFFPFFGFFVIDRDHFLEAVEEFG